MAVYSSCSLKVDGERNGAVFTAYGKLCCCAPLWSCSFAVTMELTGGLMSACRIGSAVLTHVPHPS